jgi:adenylate kinase
VVDPVQKQKRYHNERTFRILLGSGKGTQCEKMIEKYGFTHLSAGDLIRAAAQDSTTEKGRYFNESMSQGKLISTVEIKTTHIHNLFFIFQEDILGLLKDAIHEKAHEASGFLIDGFPRRIDQGKEQIEKEIFLFFPLYSLTSKLIFITVVK